MRKGILAGVAILALSAAGAARAGAVPDPVGDFLPSFVSLEDTSIPTHDADLDITNFSVSFDPGANTFTIGATLEDFDTNKSGLYVIGVDTGAGALQLFGGIGEPNVVFDRVVLVRELGATGLIVGGGALAVSHDSRSFSVVVNAADLGSTGFAARDFTFNLWSRNGLGNNNQIADFSPENRMLSGTPEPASWALMISGFALAGGVLRRRRAPKAAAFLP